MARIIRIGYNTFALPDSMPNKDVAALAGQLVTLQRVESSHNFDTSESMYYLNGGVEVKLDHVDLMDADDARAQSALSHERYKAQRDAEEKAKAQAT